MSKIDKKIEVNSFSVNVTCRKTFCLFPRQLKTNGFVKYFLFGSKSLLQMEYTPIN